MGRAGQVVVEDRSTRKRRTVVEAATTLFLRHGYLGTSMDQIAAFAAVSKPTVYKFFADKEQLFSEIVMSTLDRAGDPFRAELAALAETDHLDADLRQLGHRYLATVTQPTVLQLRRLVIGASPQLPDLARAYYERAPEQTLRALAGCFGRLAERGLLQPGDPGDFDIPIASKFAAQPGRQIAQQYAVDGVHGDGLIVDGRQAGSKAGLQARLPAPPASL